MVRTLHLLAFDDMADWEALSVIAGLRAAGEAEVIAVGFDRLPVRSASGLIHLPRIALGDLCAAGADLLLLPGGAPWAALEYPVAAVERALREFAAAGRVIAAIGTAPIALARAGLLAGRRHTGALDELADYPGRTRRRDARVVRDGGILTARADAGPALARALLHLTDTVAARRAG